jgi:hypothetical protein
VRVGAYTFPDLWPAGAEQRHRVEGRAAAGRLGPRVALSHVTAAIEHGLTVWDADLSMVHVTRLDGGAGRTESGVIHHEGLTLPSDLKTIEGNYVMHPARAAIETASSQSTEAGLVVLDSLLHLGLSTPQELADTYSLMRSWPGMRHTQVAVRLADGRAQSAGESRTRYLCYTCNVPKPQLQYEVHDASGRLLGITDFAWPEYGMLGEFDGKAKYLRYLREGEEPGDAVFREKRREELIRERTGWRMIRIVWSDLHHPTETAARIQRMLRAAA